MQKYPQLQSLHLHRVSLYFSQFEDLGKLANLKQIALNQLKSAEKANQPLLDGTRGERRSAFEFLVKLTSLELGGHKLAPFTPDEVQGISHLTNLQHITINQLQPMQVPYTILANLSSLKSLEMGKLDTNISRLQSLSFPPNGHFVPFPKSFSCLQGLTALAVGNRDRCGIGYKGRSPSQLKGLSQTAKADADRHDGRRERS